MYHLLFVIITMCDVIATVYTGFKRLNYGSQYKKKKYKYMKTFLLKLYQCGSAI